MIRYTLVLLVFNFANSQLHHSTLSTQSNSFDSNKVKVLYTVGQISPIGNYIKNGTNVVQGFQQPLLKFKIKKEVIEYSVLAYPNPFSSNISFEFKNILPGDVQVIIYDPNGRFVRAMFATNFDKILSLNLSDLSMSEYIIRFVGKNIDYSTKIIKQ